MTNKQIRAAKDSLPRLRDMNEEQEKIYRELSCREMINSIMIYGNINSPYNEKTGKLDYYLLDYAKDSGFYGIGKQRVLELVREQQADFAKANVNYGVYTDGEGCTYNSCNWGDE